MYAVIVAPRADASLKNIAKLYKAALAQVIDELKDDPYTGKPLKREFTGKYVYKVHIYRIIYTINEEEKKVKIIYAGHRSTIYQ